MAQMKNQFSRNIGKNALALLAGVLLTLACAPFNIFPLAIISAAIILVLWLDVPREIAFQRGFFYGIGLFGSGVYWLYISMHTYAYLPAAAAGALTSVAVALLALFPALKGWLLNRYFPRTNTTKILCAFPAIWVFIDWIRSWVFSGFPWLYIGYSQTLSPLKGYAPLFSVFGVSMATVLTSALIVNAYRAFKQNNRKNGYLSIAACALIWVAGGILSTVTWTKPDGRPIQISMVQANIPQQLKWLPEQVEPTLKQYKDLSASHWQNSEVIIWPEGAIPAPLSYVEDFVNEMADIAKQHHAQLITGIPIKNPENNRYFNGVISVGESTSGFYLKRRLVPFGEFIPMQNWFGRIFDILHVPMSDMTASYNFTDPLTLSHGIKMITFICYEIAFPEQVRYTLKKFGIILTVTNDAWYGHSIAQAQHLQMAQMRAIENGRPVLFATNNGLTASISPTGKILSAAPPFEATVLTTLVQPYTGNTPWQRRGMDPILLIITTFLYRAYRKRLA